MEPSYVDEREDVQKKTFAKWINSQLVKNDKPLVEDLFQDLRDGEVLLSLLEILTAQQYKRERGRMRVHHINNVNTALHVLETNGVKLVNISSNDVVDGNPKLILGLVWSIILHWQVHCHLKELMSDLQQTNLEKTLLAWCRTHTQNYAGVNVRNLSSSWADGLAFNALLHRWRPQLFDYSSVVARAPRARLEHAFSLAHTHLGIDRLLDPEDVNTPNPDKKSIMTYLMCLFQSLPHSSEDVAEVESLHSEPTTPVAAPAAEMPPSRPVSTATTGSVELGGYYSAFEEVLAWLLEAEERLADTELPPDDQLAELKEHFHRHERFLLELSERQARVGAVLEEGARLVLDAGLSRDEAAEVRLQVRLLNQRWEQLRARAMDAQAAVHAALMRAQQRHLDQFRQWLTDTEDRISRMGAGGAGGGGAGGGYARVERQLTAVRALHEDLRRQQPHVDALADCVVVVDDDPRHHDDVTEIEDQLTALSERWSHTCQWTVQQLQRLQGLHARWTALLDQHNELLQACDAHETALKQMEANPASEIGEVLARISELQRIKHGISVQQRGAAKHLEQVAALHDGRDGRDGRDGGDGHRQLLERAEALHDRLDALLMILDVQAQRIKELGFEFDINTTEETSAAVATEPEGTRTVTTTMTLATTDTRSAAKKPRLYTDTNTDDNGDNDAGPDFQVGYKVFENWADEAEKTLDNCRRELEQTGSDGDGVSGGRAGGPAGGPAGGRAGGRAGVRGALERVRAEIELQRADFSNVEEIQRRLAAEDGLQEDAKRHAESIERLKKRWENIRGTLLEMSNTMNLLEDKDNFYKNVETFQKELDDIQAWKDKMLKEKPTTNQLIHLRNKIRVAKQLEMKLKEINAQSIILLTKSLPKAHKDEVETDAKRLNDAYEDLMLYLTNKEVEIKLTVNKKPEDKHEDEFKRLQSKVNEMESRIISEHAMLTSLVRMRVKLDELSRMRGEFVALQTTYDSVVKERSEKYEKGSVQELNFRSSLENLVTRFGDTRTILDQKISKLQNGIKLLEQLESDCTEVKQWVEGVEKFLKENEYVPIGEVEPLERLLDTSNKYDEDKQKYKTKLDNIDKSKETILEDCDESLAKTIKSDTSELKKRYDAITDKCLTHNENLRRALEKTETVFRKIDEVEKWLQQLEEQIPKEEECNITDSAELYQMKTRFQTLKEKCDDKTQEFRNLNDAGAEVLEAAAGRAGVLARRLTQLSARWSDGTHAVYERHKILAEAWHESGELRSWLAQEAAWLDGLQRRLRAPPAPRADAEDLCDHLYDLENYIQNHSDERLSRIQDIGRQLIDAQIMPGWIQAEIDTITERWNALQAEASERSAALEVEAREAAQCEVALDALQRWIDSNRRDVPRADTELDEQRQALQRVEEQLQAYRATGKTEAAARLQDKLDHVQKQLSAVEQRTESCEVMPASVVTSCGDVTERLASATSALQRVQRECSRALPLASAEPDSVRAQLRTCLKFYRTLSEIKSEVESIIKTGRKMVEEKSVAEPAEFSKKIDTLKELYNKLGAQITESKTKLENALLTAREIQNDVHALTAWLDGLGTHVGKQTLELEMSRMDAVKDKLAANYHEFANNCDPARLLGLKEQIDAINARWDKLRRPARRDDSLRRVLRDAERELQPGADASEARLRALHAELRARAAELLAHDDAALSAQWRSLLDRAAAAAHKQSSVPIEYENVTDTIKRRLESPVDNPETEKPEFKKSKIPLALKSPVPIKKEIKEGGNRSRASSLERGRRTSESPLRDSISSAMSTDSMEQTSTSRLSSAPSTPGTPRKESSTFNLLKDSDLFTQISNNNIQPDNVQPEVTPDPCHVVAVKEHEIVKSTVNPVEPMEIYPFEAIDAVVEFVPQNVETVEIIDDTENESFSESDSEDRDVIETKPTVHFGSEPKTFVIEVKTLEHRMKPTLGILKRKCEEDVEEGNGGGAGRDVPDVIPSREHDVSMSTPPPTPTPTSSDAACPLLYDLAVRQKEAQRNLRRDEVNEYLILDEVPRDQAALPEPSATEHIANDQLEDRKEVDVTNATIKAGDDVTPQTVQNKDVCEDEVIYSEVEDRPQSRVSASEFEEKAPLSTSTPIKEERRQPVHVVAMSPKPTAEDNEESTPPSPLPKNKREHKSPTPPAKSHIPISKERLKHNEKYQRTDDGTQVEPTLTPTPTSTVSSEASVLRARFPSECDAALEQFAAEAGALSRRMDVMLVTVGGVDVERDPGKRLEILKNQLGLLAPDAAALISRGDSLVYDKHKKNPLLADYIQTHFQDKLRNKWSMVMSEIEIKRNQAIKAEDNIKEVNKLVDTLRTWLDELDGKLTNEDTDVLRGELLDREGDVERLQELCRELKAQRVGYQERGVTDVLSAAARANDKVQAATNARDNRTKPEAGESAACEWVARANRARAAVAAAGAPLRTAPLAGRDFDEFPLQEDALARVQSAMEDIQPMIDETEKEYTKITKKCRPTQSEQARRVLDKLLGEWRALQHAHERRAARWAQCRDTWRALYRALDDAGAWLDAAERTLRDMQHPTHNALPHNQLKQKVHELEREMASRASALCAVRAGARAVSGACAAGLARLVLEQLDALAERWAGAAASLAAHTQLLLVAELLDTTTPNPSDRTSLSIRLSLVKAREEELASKVREMEVLRDNKQLNTAEQTATLQHQLEKAQSNLSTHRSYLTSKLSALGKYWARLDAAAAWLGEARARAAAAAARPQPQRDALLANIAVCVKDREAEVREVLENYNNIERECVAAKQTVCPDLRDKLHRLNDDWAALRAITTLTTTDTTTTIATTTTTTTTTTTDNITSEPSTPRKGSVDSQASDWSGRSSGRRRSSQQSPAVLLAHFDTTVQQIRDWVSVEVDMLRAQSVAVGDVDDILHQLDKQKGVLRELEQKKPQLDELLHTAESLKGTENRQQLHGKVTALREHWDEANARVLQRKAQLDAMLGDSQRYEARRRDADAWLSRMETRLGAMPPPGHTADVLELQLREQKSFHAEVHQYKHQIELFGQLTQRLIAVYRNDDTSRIKRSTEAINHRYNELNNSIIARGKALHSAVSSLQNFDRSLENFVAWLSEGESLLDAAERDPHLLKVSENVSPNKQSTGQVAPVSNNPVQTFRTLHINGIDILSSPIPTRKNSAQWLD